MDSYGFFGEAESVRGLVVLWPINLQVLQRPSLQRNSFG